MTGRHTNKNTVGLVSLWKMPVRAGIRVLGRKDLIVTGTCRLCLVGLDTLVPSSTNPLDVGLEKFQCFFLSRTKICPLPGEN